MANTTKTNFGALWIANEGKAFFSGVIGTQKTKITVYANDFATKENKQPQFNVVNTATKAKIGGLWESDEGYKSFASGKIDDVKVIVFPNDYATKENKQPQYNILEQKPKAAAPTTKVEPIRQENTTDFNSIEDDEAAPWD